MTNGFTAFDPHTEVSGIIIISYVQSMWADDIIPIIKKHGYENVAPDGWYPIQPWLDFLTEVYKLPDGPSRMVSLGMKIGQAMPFPPEVTTFEQVAAGAGASSDMVHRGGRWGSITYEKVSDTHLRIINHTPYPDESVYGTYWAFAKRFLPHGTDFTVISSQAGKTRFPSADGEPLVIDFRWK